MSTPTFKAWLEHRINTLKKEIAAAERDRVNKGTIAVLVMKKVRYEKALDEAVAGFRRFQ